MRVLIIGQLPKEIGGNYTTGAANVVYELSKHNVEGIVKYTFGTNISAKYAKINSIYKNQYIGYTIAPFSLIWRVLRNPYSFVKHFIHYRNVDHCSPFRFFFYEDNIARIIRTLQPDIIHVNSINNVSATYFALDGKKIPILLTCHGIFYRGDEDDYIGREIYLGNIGLADSYTGLTKESLNEYQRFLGIPKDKIDVIPNGVDCNKFFYSVVERRKMRDFYKVSDDCIVFITVASIQERKGQLEFIKLLEHLRLEYQYWIIGNGPDEEIVREYISKRNLGKNIKLIGYCNSDQLYKYYSAADVYAHVSWKEGQALSELEANATGLRTIVNKAIIGTIANEITLSNYFVIDFESQDFSCLEHWILSRPDYRVSKRNFDWSVISEMYASVYKRISK